MRKVNLIVLALVAIYLLVVAVAFGQGGNPPASTKESGATSGHGMTGVEQTGKGGNVEQELTALTNQMIQALLKSDTSFFDKNSTADYTAIHSDGRLTTKAQELDAFKSGALKYESIDMRDRKVRVYGTTALVITLSSAKGTLNGKPFSGEFRTTRTWVKQGGNWKMVAFQSTRAASASQ